MTQPQQSSQNQKSQSGEKNSDNSDLGSNNPVKKEGVERRDNRDNVGKTNQNLGSQKFRETNLESGKDDRSAR